MKRIYLLAALLALPLITSCAERVYPAPYDSAYKLIYVGGTGTGTDRPEYSWDADLKKK